MFGTLIYGMMDMLCKAGKCVENGVPGLDQDPGRFNHICVGINLQQ